MNETDEWEDSPTPPDTSDMTGPVASRYLCVCKVVNDFVPTTHENLTLFRDELVYVYSKESKKQSGWWEGESRGIFGAFPPEHVKEVKI